MADSNYIKHVRCIIDGKSGFEYQKEVGIILEKYCEYKGVEFECPSPYGGDDKNDGWIPQWAHFYQVYSPVHYNVSFEKDVHQKFEEDIKGLCKKVYEQGLWGGKINKFIFIVNTRDNTLPKDSHRRCETIVHELENKYSIKIDYKIVNGDYIEDLLSEIEDEKILRQILIRLRADNTYQYSNINESSVIEFMDSIGGKISQLYASDDAMGSGYFRVSTDEKININNLVNKKDEIKNLICKLGVVESVASEYKRKAPLNTQYDTIKGYIINKYNEQKKLCSGEELFESLLKELVDIDPKRQGIEAHAKLFLVYVFDKCDIFEKEIKNDFARQIHTAKR